MKIAPQAYAESRDAYRAGKEIRVRRMHAAGIPLFLYPGNSVLDPQGRHVIVQKVEGDTVTVRLGGSYGATVRYPASVLREAGST